MLFNMKSAVVKPLIKKKSLNLTFEADSLSQT